MKTLQILGWIFALLLAGCGVLIYMTQYTYRFCAYALWLIAAFIVMFLLLGIMSIYAGGAAKILRLILSTLVGLVILATAATAIRISSTATASKVPAESNYLIVLGCTVDGDQPSRMLQYRITAAYNYLNKYPHAQCIVSGGLGEGDTVTEAQCMKNELTAMGIDPDRIWLEERSTSTKENLLYSVALLGDKESGSIAVLSSEFHLYRVEQTAERLGLKIQTVPAKTEKKILLLNNMIREIPAVWFYDIIGG